MVIGNEICTVPAFVSELKIGAHVSKGTHVNKTLAGLDPECPWQIFIGNPQSVKVSMKPEDIELTRALVVERNMRVFVHAPYIINLSNASAFYAIDGLCEYMRVASAMGMRGVVVHVGKSCKIPVAEAIENMARAIERVLESSVGCSAKLLIETPAGQGSELLTTYDSFRDFVRRFGGRLRVCVDTCHVFASGISPMEYLERAVADDLGVDLIHFNDSREMCGACKDRHALVGSGHIGSTMMETIAMYANSVGIPMVIE